MVRSLCDNNPPRILSLATLFTRVFARRRKVVVVITTHIAAANTVGRARAPPPVAEPLLQLGAINFIRALARRACTFTIALVLAIALRARSRRRCLREMRRRRMKGCVAWELEGSLVGISNLKQKTLKISPTDQF